MLLSSFFTRSMAFTHTPKVQLPFALFSETFLTIRQNSLYVTVCMIVSTLLEHITHSLSTLYYYNAPSLTIRLTGNYRSWTFTNWRDPASLGTRKTGACFDCKTPDTICCQILITRYSKTPQRIKVILVNEDLGF